MKYPKIILLIVLFTCLAVSEPYPDSLAFVKQSQITHGLKSWWNYKAVAASLNLEFGEKKLFDSARFVFEAHGSKAMYRSEDKKVVHSGENCYVSPAESVDGKERFHVWTWPWFLFAPMKMMGEGIQLSDYQEIELNGVKYKTVLQTFSDTSGDAPDDWYRLFINPETNLLDAMSYIVTYGKSKEKANESTSIILYKNYQDFNGVRLATKFELWYWENAGLKGDVPKAKGEWLDLQVVDEIQEQWFQIPENSREVKLP